MLRRPTVYRSREQSLIIGVFTLVVTLFILGIAAAPATGLSTLARVAMVLLALTSATFVFMRVVRAGVYVDEEGIRILNPFRTFHVPWSSVARFDLRTNARLPFRTGCVELNDGKAIPIWGIQPPNPLTRPRNRSAQRLIDALNQELSPWRDLDL